jgi:nitroreductase
VKTLSGRRYDATPPIARRPGQPYGRFIADLERTMRTAFACRDFTDEPVTDEDLVGLLELARFAPSGGNRQGWRVVVVRDQATKDQLVELSLPALRLYVAQRAAGENPWNTIVPSAVDPASIDHNDNSAVEWFRILARAPVLLVVGVDLSVVASADSQLDRIGVISGGSIYPFVQNLLLAARARGLAGALTTFLAASEPAAQALLGLPPEVAVAALVPVGHPKHDITRLSRRPVSSFARLERWDGPPLS